MFVSKRNVILGVLALGLFAVDYASMPEAHKEREIQRLFPDLRASLARRIVVTEAGGGGALDLQRAEGEELARAPHASWRIPALYAWPAFDSPMRSLLRWVENLSTLDLLASDLASHADYGLLESEGIRIQIFDAQGELQADFLQGDLAPGGGACYVRLTGEDEVWRAPGVRGRLRSDPKIWMESDWLPLSRAESLVTAIELSGGDIGTPLRLERSKASVELWRQQDGELAPSSHVRALLDELGALVVDEVLAGSPSMDLLDQPRLALRLERSDGEPWTAYLGEEDAAGLVPATRGADDWLVAFPATAIKRLLESAQRLQGE